MNLSSESRVGTISSIIRMPVLDGIILFSPVTLITVKYSYEVSKLIDLCSVESTLESLHRRGQLIGLCAEYDEYLKIVEDMYHKGIVTIDGNKTQSVQIDKDRKQYDSITSPSVAAVNLTHRCNKKCIYCFNEEFRSIEDGDELDADEWMLILNNLVDSGVNTIVITGGEPLLRMDVIKKISRNIRENVRYGLITNASLVTVENATVIKKVFGNNISVSIDSHNPEIADRLRGKGTYATVNNAIEIFNSNKIRWKANVVLTKYNIDHYEETYKWLVGNYCREISPIIQSIGDIGINPSVPSLLQIERYLDKRYEDISKTENRLDCDDDLVHSKSTFVAKKRACSAAIAECAVCAQGYVYPCRMLMHEKLKSKSTLLAENFVNIWENDIVLEKIRGLIKIPNTCYSCEFLKLCAGECHGHRLLPNGEIGDRVNKDACKAYKQIIAKKIMINIALQERKISV